GAGGLHGIHPAFTAPEHPANGIDGQYFQAFPGHEAGLEVALESGLAKRWSKIAEGIGIATALLPEAASATRGEWIRAAWNAHLGVR
ncbi:MAG: FAD-dependent oxidoreductase, partial [Verrucomicrobia bacterium]|nr:FAD-dependent oxidoreductase [Verrucomicrobiota bacterium]